MFGHLDDRAPFSFPLGPCIFVSPMCIVFYRFAPFHQTTDFSTVCCVSSLGVDGRALCRVLPLLHLAPDFRISAVFFSIFVCLPPYGRSEFIPWYALALIMSLEFELFCFHCFFFLRPFLFCHVARRVSSEFSRRSQDKPDSYRRMQISADSIRFRLAS